jgi:glyoxylase-like metal-dependent hydrolase (beta-lactamase superfamily II)
VRDRGWVGTYRIRGDAVSAEFAGRCADRWMEPSPQVEHAGAPQSAEDAARYHFQVLQPEEPCRSYLIGDPSSKLAVLVDPLREHVDTYLEQLRAGGWKLAYTVETHTHADHLSGSVRLKELTGAKLAMHGSATAPCVDLHLKDGDQLTIGELVMEVIESAGHTKDSMCLHLPGRLLTGDTLLIGGCGRTDLPTGDAKALYASLRRLMELPDDLLVFPAHDYQGRRATTIGLERKGNPRIQLGEEEFARVMNELDLPPPLRLREALQANLHCL